MIIRITPLDRIDIKGRGKAFVVAPDAGPFKVGTFVSDNGEVYEVRSIERSDNGGQLLLVQSCQLPDRPFTYDEQADHCHILRELGFKPHRIGYWHRELCEIMPLPFFKNPGDRNARVKIRTRIGDPLTMVELDCSDMDTPETFASRISGFEFPSGLEDFLNKIGRYLEEVQARSTH